MFSKKEDVKKSSYKLKYISESIKSIVNKLERLDLLKTNLFEDDRTIKWSKLRIAFELLFILIINQLIEGSSKVKSVFNIQQCSYVWISINFAFIIVCFIIVYMIIQNMYKENKLSLILHKIFIDYKIKDDHQNDDGNEECKNNENDESFNIAKCSNNDLLVITFKTIYAGIISGMLGIGGGMIITPLLIELGVKPNVATSTSNFLLIFSSCASTIQYMISGQLMFDYGIVLALIGMVSSIIGYRVISDYVKQTGKSSFLLLLLTYLLGSSLIILPLASFKKLLFDISHNIDVFKFKSVC